MAITELIEKRKTGKHYSSFLTLRSLIFKHMAHLEHGYVEVTETDTDGESFVFGSPDASLKAHVFVHNERFYSKAIKGGSIGMAEAYIDGWWDCDELTELVQIMALNTSLVDKIERYTGLISQIITRIGHWKHRNSLSQSKRNILAHYDLGNHFYSQFLDKSMLYSSAIFYHMTDSLEQAQQNKMARLCEQLDLCTDDHVLEIGSGWGALAIYIAQHYGCHVTTTTLSDEQFAYTQQRIIESGLQNKITLLKQDYRQLTGSFDKLVSVEMIEAVGKRYLPDFIKQCNRLVKPNGIMVIQAITIADQRYEYYSQHVDFIQKYIFPGGFLPSITALVSGMTRYSHFILNNLTDIGLSYAETLKSWRQRFNDQEHAIREQGFDDAFIRLWRFYLCYCEGGFRAKSISTVQLTFRRQSD